MPFSIIKLVRHISPVTPAMVAFAVGNRRINGYSFGIDHIMGIPVDGYPVRSGFKHICFRVFVIVRGHLFKVKADLKPLRSAGGKLFCLFETDQVSKCFFDPSVGIRRIIVDLNGILACCCAGIRHSHIKSDLAVIYLRLGHCLAEGGVAHTIAKWILDNIIISDGTIHGSGLVEPVPHVNAFNIIDIGGDRCAEHPFDFILLHIVIIETPKIIPPWGFGEVPDKSICCTSRRVLFSCKDLAQRIKTGLSCGRTP